jgi:hypothetical protein
VNEIDAIDAHGALAWRDEAEDHPGHSGFARARFAYQAQRFAGFDGERNILHNGMEFRSQANPARVAS